MQATNCEILVMPLPKKKPAQAAPNPKPEELKQSSRALSTFAQIVSAAAAMVALFFTFYFHYSEQNSKSADDHTKNLIRTEVDPKLDALGQRIGALDEKISFVQGQLQRMSGTVTPEQTEKIFKTIRDEVSSAESKNQELPGSRIAEMKTLIQYFPQSTGSYWETAARIINYQSHRDQLTGKAPNPMDVSKPCGGMTTGTGGFNVLDHVPLHNCVVDLDETHNVFDTVTFQNCVIRYHGGKVTASNITFVNCFFILEISKKTVPKKPDIFYALLQSPSQTLVKVD